MASVPLSSGPSFSWEKIPHYYGDIVRVLFIAAAVLILIAIPALENLLPFGTAIEVVYAVLLVLLAAFTNPHGKAVLVANAVVSGIGLVIFEAAAIVFYAKSSQVLFLAQEVMAVLFLFSLYFSVKTIRATIMGTLGHAGNTFGEFEKEDNEDTQGTK